MLTSYFTVSINFTQKPQFKYVFEVIVICNSLTAIVKCYIKLVALMSVV